MLLLHLQPQTHKSIVAFHFQGLYSICDEQVEFKLILKLLIDIKKKDLWLFY